MEDFINRSYTKKELGLMYFPESMPRTAVNHLMSWIRRCQPLWDELQQMKETVITIKIFFHGIKQLFSVYFACIEYIFFDGRKGISGCGKTSPVKTIVVVNTA